MNIAFSDGVSERYGAVIAADGIYSQTRQSLFPDAPKPAFTGQGVWRYSLPRPAELNGLCVFNGPTGVGLVPMSPDTMYLFVTTPEPDNLRYSEDTMAATMRAKLSGIPAAQIRELASQIVDDSGVVYRPLEAFLLDGA